VSSVTEPGPRSGSQDLARRAPWGVLVRAAAAVALRRPALWLYAAVLFLGWWMLSVALGLVPSRDDPDPSPWLREFAWLAALASLSLVLLWLPRAHSLEVGLGVWDRLTSRSALFLAAALGSILLVVYLPWSLGWLAGSWEESVLLGTLTLHSACLCLFLAALPLPGITAVALLWLGAWMVPTLWPEGPLTSLLPLPLELHSDLRPGSTWNLSPWLAILGWLLASLALHLPRPTR
jgi:hypothetical protein